jgi:AbrB family looped-hinge helix DNA binding protein
MKVTSKGQVTIPKEVREKLGIRPGDEIGFREDGQQYIVENQSAPQDETEGERMVRLMVEFGREAKRKGHFNDGMTTDEYMELIRGYSEDENDPGFQHHP